LFFVFLLYFHKYIISALRHLHGSMIKINQFHARESLNFLQNTSQLLPSKRYTALSSHVDLLGKIKVRKGNQFEGFCNKGWHFAYLSIKHWTRRSIEPGGPQMWDCQLHT